MTSQSIWMGEFLLFVTSGEANKFLSTLNAAIDAHQVPPVNSTTAKVRVIVLRLDRADMQRFAQEFGASSPKSEVRTYPGDTILLLDKGAVRACNDFQIDYKSHCSVGPDKRYPPWARRVIDKSYRSEAGPYAGRDPQ